MQISGVRMIAGVFLLFCAIVLWEEATIGEGSRVLAQTPSVLVVQSDGNTQVIEGNGSTDSYTVQLTVAPTATVVLTATVADGQSVIKPEGGVFSTTVRLVFAPDTWDVPQRVMVRATDDDQKEIVHTSTISQSITSRDPSYHDSPVDNVRVLIIDDDTLPRLTIPTDIPAHAGETVEVPVRLDPDGASIVSTTFRLHLDNRLLSLTPGRSVVTSGVPGGWKVIISSNPSSGEIHGELFAEDNMSPPIEGSSLLTMSLQVAHPVMTTTTAITFSPTISPTFIHTMDDRGYRIPGTTHDGSVIIGVSTTPSVLIGESDGHTLVAEGVGNTDSYTVALGGLPTGPVTITARATSGQTEVKSEGGAFSDTATLTFIPTTWTTPQTITVRAVDDRIMEKQHTGTISHTASGGGYEGLAIVGVTVHITDDDEGPLLRIPQHISTTAEITTMATVQVPVHFEPRGVEVTTTTFVLDIDEAWLTFSPDHHPAQFNLPPGWASSVISRTEETDGEIGVVLSDPFEPYIPLSSSTLMTLTFGVRTPPVTTTAPVAFAPAPPAMFGSASGVVTGNTEDGSVLIGVPTTPSVHIVETDGGIEVSEGDGSTDSYAVILGGLPSGTVVVHAAVIDAQTEIKKQRGTYGDAVLLTFSPTTWTTPQTVTVRAVDDSVDEEEHTSTISHSVSGGGYDGLQVKMVEVHIADNDAAIPVLSIEPRIAANSGEAVEVPVVFAADGADIASISFSLDYDETWLSFHPTDTDNDDIPDALSFNLLTGWRATAEYDATDNNGEIDIVVFDTDTPLTTIPDGTLLTVRLDTGFPVAQVVSRVGFSPDPVATFGSTEGEDRAGTTSDGSVLITPAAENEPVLDIPNTIVAPAGTTVDVPVSFAANGAEVASIAFSLDYDETLLTFDATDSDNDDIPDALNFNLPTGWTPIVLHNAADTDGEIDIVAFDEQSPVTSLSDGTLLTLRFTVGTPSEATAADVGFSASPSATFGDPSGQNVVGRASDGFVWIPIEETNIPALAIARRVTAMPGETVEVPVTFTSNGASIASIAFSLDINSSLLTYNAAGTTFSLPAGWQKSITEDLSDTDGELDVLIYNNADPLKALTNGEVMRLAFHVGSEVDAATSGIVFATDPSVSFGSTEGEDISGTTQSGSVRIGTGGEVLYLPIIQKHSGEPLPTPTPTDPAQATHTPTEPAQPTPTPTEPAQATHTPTEPAQATHTPTDPTQPTPTETETLQPTPTETETLQPTPTETEIVQPTPTPTTEPVPDTWLGYVNWLRGLSGLPPVTENTIWSDGCWKHSRYMVKNDVIGHSEDSSNEWYTEEGDQAARSGNVAVTSRTNYTYQNAIDMWMTGPFHGIGIIDPKLNQSAFGLYTEAVGRWQGGATLDVNRGRGSMPDGVTFPILFPGNGTEMPYTRYTGNESPDPLTSCPGYTAPSGPPIMMQLGDTPDVTAYSINRDGQPLEACLFDETSYVNSNSSYQSLGRSVLRMRHAVVLMPREPLTAGTYFVSITANGTAHTWSFTISGMLQQQSEGGTQEMR
jgi:uncharacterized protein YkwD